MSQDSLLANMSYDSWKSSVDPKVKGSWNLHECCPTDLDFFILLASVAGIAGLRGQSNYAAGNTFMDSLAKYRNAHGRKAVALDLGAMLSEGLLAENATLRDRVLASGNLIPITQDMLFALLDHFCNPHLEFPSQSQCQAVIGIETPANIRAKGHEEDGWLYAPLFRHLWQIEGTAEESVTAAVEAKADFKKLLATASTLPEAGSIITQAIVAKLSRSLSVLKDHVDLAKPMHSYGFDSLLAVELRTWLGREFGADVPIFELMGGTSFTAVGISAAEKSRFFSTGWGGGRSRRLSGGMEP